MANEPQTMKVNDVEYVRADSVNVEPSEIQIVVLQRGWVVWPLSKLKKRDNATTGSNWPAGLSPKRTR